MMSESGSANAGGGGFDFSGAGAFIAALSAFSGGIINADAISGQGKFQAEQLRLNSTLAQLQGRSVLEAGNEQASLVGRNVKKTIGAERAGFAGQGVQVDSGTPGAVQTSSQEQGAIMQQTIRSNAWREAWGFDVEASNFRSEADMKDLETQREASSSLLTGGLKAIQYLER